MLFIKIIPNLYSILIYLIKINRIKIIKKNPIYILTL